VGGTPPDDGRFADLPRIDVVIPDDPRELELDRIDLLREEAALARIREQEERAAAQSSGARAGRGERFARRLLGRRYERYGLSGLLVAAVLLVVSGVGGLLVVFGPRASGPPHVTPLASPTTRPGHAGGLLPRATVAVNGRDTDVRKLRPAVLALPAAGCRCVSALREVSRRAWNEFHLRPYLVTPGLEAQRLARAVNDGVSEPVVDGARSLSTVYGARGLTLLFVRDDGVVTQVVRDWSPDDAPLEPLLLGVASAAH
jgi:hypothetical protein